MEREQVGEDTVLEALLHPERELALEAVDQVGETTDPWLDCLVVLVDEGLEQVHQDVHGDVPLVPLRPDFVRKPTDWQPHLGLVPRQQTLQWDGDREYDHHHGLVGAHGPHHGHAARMSKS